MGYLNEDGLARYDGLLKNWVTFKSGTVDGVDPLLNWQKTATAGAVTCYPLPAAPIDPTVNFVFTETGPASGDKAPDNPSIITGVTQAKVTRCGKNVIPFPYASSSQEAGGITWTVNDDGTVSASGTATANSFFTFYAANSGILKPGVQYTLSCCPSGGSASTYYVRFGSGSNYDDYGNGSTFVADEAIAPRNLIARIASGTVLSTPITFKPQLELGSAATSFEPYSGADYTIDLGGTYYGGSVDLSTGTMTVTWSAYKFTGTESWQLESNSTPSVNNFRIIAPIPDNLLPMSVSASALTRACSHLSYASDVIVNTFNTWALNPRILIRRAVSEISDAVALNNWLASEYANGTPVTVAYQLATPYTVQLTPTQIYSLSQPDPYATRINTVYSDQTSVQVGYPKSPQATSTELTNAIISLGSNL